MKNRKVVEVMYRVLIVRETKRQGLDILMKMHDTLIKDAIPCKIIGSRLELRVADNLFSIKCMTYKEGFCGVRADAVIGVGDFERLNIIQGSKLEVASQLDTIDSLVSHIKYKYVEYVESLGIDDKTKIVNGEVQIHIKAENKEQCDEVICAVIGALMTHRSIGKMKDVHDCNVQVSVSNGVGTERYTQDIK